MTRIDVCNEVKVLLICQVLDIGDIYNGDTWHPSIIWSALSQSQCPPYLSLTQCHTSSLVHSDHQSASGIVSSIIIISGMTRTTVDILRLELLHRGFSITHPLIQAWVHILLRTFVGLKWIYVWIWYIWTTNWAQNDFPKLQFFVPKKYRVSQKKC